MRFAEILEADHRIGTLDAEFRLLEFGDYECEFSKEAERDIRQILSQAKHHLCFAYRHYPLRSAHPHAEAAALAAEAAFSLGAFWEFHRELYRLSSVVDESRLLSIAEKLGIDPRRFREEMQSETALRRVRHNVVSGLRLGVRSTPTFFLNGVYIDRPLKRIQEMLAENWKVDSVANA